MPGVARATGADAQASQLLRKYLLDKRFLFTLPRAVGLQMLHPAIACATAEHALYRDHVWLHKQRTVTQAIEIAVSDRDMRPSIRFTHEHVRGRTASGATYHALQPDLFHFQHATYVEALFTMVATFVGPLDPGGQDQLYRGCCQWYGRYGISMRPVPASWPEFGEYFESNCRAELRAGAHFEQFRTEIMAPSNWWPRVVPSRAIRAMQHPYARELAGIEVSAGDDRSLRMFARTCRWLSL
jgi:uncharacterized protein (DUF2236 family)